ncbi:MAG: phosphatidate cytidylyltransferase [Anaerolineae bacterium]|nr:phosphatidate cytidylyltransferase [Anaerolineae bacterium]
MLSLYKYPNLVIALGAIIALLLCVQFIIYPLLARTGLDLELDKLDSRLRFWWTIVIGFLFGVVLGSKFLLLLIAFSCFLALKEFLSITPSRRADRRVLFFAYLTLPLQFYWIWIGWYGMFIVFIPVYVFLFLPLPMTLLGETKGFLRAFSLLNWIIMTAVFSLSHLGFLLVLPDSLNPVAGGIGLAFFLMLLVQVNDASQFIFGSITRERKVIPKLSASRTWSGLISGLVLTVIVAALTAPFLTPFSPIEAIGLGILIALTGLIGYIVFSAIKRDLDFEDRGTMTPGHGGILNRVDTLVYAAPLFFHITSYLYS